MAPRRAFTLLELLISAALLSLVLLGLYRSLEIQRQSNRQLQDYLIRAMEKDKVAMVLYRDLLQSDGNLTLHKGEFDRLCIESTSHSLYALDRPKVCWLVGKEDNTLIRVEGGNYHLPLKMEEHVAIDRLIPKMELFDLYRKKGDLLVVFKALDSDPYSFLLQGIEQPPKPKPKTKTKKRKPHRKKPGKKRPPSKPGSKPKKPPAHKPTN